MEMYKILLLCFSLTSMFMASKAIDKISSTQSIRNGGDTIVSAGEFFELGFFNLGNSTDRRYLGIRYKVGRTVVWVANREAPLSNSSGVLKFNDRGVLVLLNQDNLIIWSTNSSVVIRNPIAQLLDSGNLVIRDENDVDSRSYYWQSFHYPDQTFLPGMKFGRLAGGLDVRFSSWKSVGDPSRGIFTSLIDSSLQIIVLRNSSVFYRTGPWNGIGFSGLPYLKPNPMFKYKFVVNQKEIYYTFELSNNSVHSRVILNQNGMMVRYTWIDRIRDWQLYSSAQTDNCGTYALCGPHGRCDSSNALACSCLDKFMPKFENQWKTADWSGGCVRRMPLDCQKGDEFIRYANVKLPDMLNSLMNASMTREECRMVCLKNCSCMAYANTDIRGSGSGCFLWFGDLIDIIQYSENGGQDLYIRMASSELAAESHSNSNRTKLAIIASSVSVTAMLLLAMSLGFFIVQKKRKKQQTEQGQRENNPEDLEIPQFDFCDIANATNSFSFNNVLGEGGFGPVYKGILKEGQAIAVKRLSKESRQGLDEFMNEVKCIAKLQHRNLVKLLGYCIQHDEKMLIYEYLPNKSLDWYIFDKSRSKLLDWDMKLKIIDGVSRGLLYLHQDSRLRIIHRDLKLSNILLDHEMNPKISDFGLARTFKDNESEANTIRVVGTYGYMSPEYAIDGLFSIKSDVFSYGVVMLEIISGKSNRGFIHPNHQLNLLGHAWILFKEGRCPELVDTLSMGSHNLPKVLRLIHIGLLCVQNYPEDRPSMSSVVLMLSGESKLPDPKEPGFFTERKLTESDISSIDEITATTVVLR